MISTVYDFKILPDVKLGANSKMVPALLEKLEIRVAFCKGYSCSTDGDEKIQESFLKCLPEGFCFYIEKVGEYHEIPNSPFTMIEYLQNVCKYRKPSTWYQEDFPLIDTSNLNTGASIAKHLVLTPEDVRLMRRAIWMALDESGIKFIPESKPEDFIPPFFKQ